ncbi:hypothetical protein FWF89_01310 [Candidatus Saccharibacteria bacterium]|nr:hypothetical protein [Candidatus Saccharibacteria bacterium]
MFGLALVVAITVIASGIPPAHQENVSAAPKSTDIMVGVEITAENSYVEIIEPSYGTIFYDGNTNVAIFDYDNVSSLTAWLTLPDGSTIEIPLVIGGGSITLDLGPYLIEYGTYTLEVTGYDLVSDPIPGDATSFNFHAITVGPTIGSDGKPVDSTVRVHFGPAVCRLNVQVFPEGDTEGEPLIEYFIDDISSYPTYMDGYIDIKIPGFSELDANQEYTVVVTAFDCGPEGGDPLEDGETILNGVMGPPDTGVFTIFGLSLGRIDYLISGLFIFIAAIVIALFFIHRNKKARR